jgi:Ca2+/Na+ antiporter
MAEAEAKSQVSRLGILPFAVTIFLGAFLLFLVQPLIGKYILPWFGGTPGVWTTCLLFFQCLLLGGYAYAHCLNYFLPLRKQIIVHGVLLFLAMVTLPITPSESLKPTGGESPTVQILLLLTLSIGLPYLVLSATGPLIQAWFAKANPGRSPYRLYALSNVGSLLALLGFPFLVEPWTARSQQVNWWSVGMVLYALVCGYLVWLLRSLPEPEPGKKQKETKETESRMRHGAIWFFWLALPACGTALLMATTNKMCQDVAVVPFLWVLPLALYLVTFIISFDSPRRYVREIYVPLLIVCWAGVVWVMFEGVEVHIVWQVVLFCVALFVSCMVCHGELYRLRPESARLTQYFLGISAGGAMGGFFVAVLAPMLFTGYWEYHISLWGVGFLFLLVQILQRKRWLLGKWHVRCVLAVCWGTVCLVMFRYTSFGWAARIAITFVPLLGGWWITSLVLRHWWYGRQITELMEIKSAFVGLVLALVTLIWSIGMTGALNTNFSFTSAWNELTPGLWLALVLLLLNLFVWQSVRRWEGLKIGWAWCFLLLIPSLIALGFGLRKQAAGTQQDAVYADRNFYGTLKINRYTDSLGSPYYLLLNGRITHGCQYEEIKLCDRITTYYTEGSGAGLAVALTPKLNKRVGVVGMGVGTMAGYAMDGDVYRLYDINPLVEKMSSDEVHQFTFRMNAVKVRNAIVDVKLGDARLTMEQELKRGEAQNYDVLILDAFSSDSIPVHLLTKESMELYEKHMNPEGVIAIHISNRYLDLEPVVRRLAKETHYPMVVTECYSGEDYDEDWIYACTWILLTRNEGIIKKLEEQGHNRSDLSQQEDLPLWTDDYASIFRIMHKPEWLPGWLGGD